MEIAVAGQISALSEAIDQLAATDPFSYADPDSIVALERQLARLECVLTAAVGDFDAGGEWAPDGAKSASAWLATRCHLPKAMARGQVRRAKALRALPLCALAWSEGDIGAAQLDALDNVRSPRTSDTVARDEAVLVDQAKTLRFEALRRALSYWEQLADPDGADAHDVARRARRDVCLSASISGMWLGEMTLDPISGTIVAEELGRLERDLFDADWATAQLELGRPPRLDELTRSSGQRRADALVEMARRSKASPADARRPEPLFSVLVGYETLHGRICELAGGQVLSPGALVPWLDHAAIERAVFLPGRRVEVSVSSRLFSGATRRAIELRDRECTHDYCDVAASHCQIDHIVPYSQGGPTTQENGRLLCGFHNRQRNQRPPPGG